MNIGKKCNVLDLLRMDELIPIYEIDILARDIEQSRDRWSINGLFYTN